MIVPAMRPSRPWRHLMTQKNDIIIIGAGVVGCSIAYHLAKKGITSTIVERESIGARASGKAWAVIAYPPYLFTAEEDPDFFYSLPEGEAMAQWQDLFWSAYYRLSDLSLDIMKKGRIDVEYGDFPSTRIAKTESAEISYKTLMSSLIENGYYACEWLEADELRAIFPGINPEVRGGLSVPQLQVEPYKFTLGLAQAAEAMGAEIRHGDVVGFDTKGDRITSIRLASGARIDADVCVLATGPWSGRATSWLGSEVPILNAMTECFRVRPRKTFPEHCLGGEVTILSRVNGDVILASAEAHTKEEYFGLKARSDFQTPLSEEVKIKNIEAATDILPWLLEDADLVEHRGDLLAYGPDPYYHKPVMGRLPGWENGYIATRFGAFGIQMSVGAGELMAELIANDRVPFHAKQMLNHVSPEG
jgi:glycine oxidase